MTAADYQAEWNYRLNERLGIICDGRPATEREIQRAKLEADEAVAKLRDQERKNSNALR